MTNRDRYSNYAHLSRHEQKGIDYRIRFISSSDIAIIAPHECSFSSSKKLCRS